LFFWNCWNGLTIRERHWSTGCRKPAPQTLNTGPSWWSEKAIDDKSRLGVFDDMNKLMQMKTALALAANL
jgi:hypothetical protein